MTTSTSVRSPMQTVADLLDRLGDIPLARIRLHPAPGTATEADVLTYPDGVKRLCELVDGVLVEKPMGYYESMLVIILGQWLRNFLDQNDLGIVLAPDGPLRLEPGLVRLPDLSFIAWERFPNRELPAEPILRLAPDLAVEVLSASNTDTEMERKLKEYFAAGVRLVWYVEPVSKRVRVYTSLTDIRVLDETETLDGGDVLPGFQMPIRELFRRAGRRQGPESP